MFVRVYTQGAFIANAHTATGLCFACWLPPITPNVNYRPLYRALLSIAQNGVDPEVTPIDFAFRFPYAQVVSPPLRVNLRYYIATFEAVLFFLFRVIFLLNNSFPTILAFHVAFRIVRL